MKFSLLVVNYNGEGRLPRCLAAIAGQSFRDFEVLVVDNASTDNSANTPLPDERFRWLLPGKNLGFAAANNLAAREAQGDWLFLVNPDAYLEPECLNVLYSATLRHDTVSLFGCTQLDDAVPEILDGAGDCYFFAGYPWRGGKGWGVEMLPDEGEIWGPCGAAYLIRRTVFLDAGGFDEDFFGYCEDVDLNFRLRLAGHRAIQVVEAFVRHEGSGITGERSTFPVFHGTRNCIWTYVKNMPPVFFWLFLPVHLAVLGALMLSPKSFKARRDAVKAALEGLPLMWQKRQQIQKSRKISYMQLARALSWNPMMFLWRRIGVQPIKPHQ